MIFTGTLTTYLHCKRDYASKVPTFSVTACDMSDYGYTLVDTQDITVTYNIPDNFSIDAEEIKRLQAEKKKLMANHQIMIMHIDESIQKLLCIEGTPA